MTISADGRGAGVDVEIKKSDFKKLAVVKKRSCRRRRRRSCDALLGHFLL